MIDERIKALVSVALSDKNKSKLVQIVHDGEQAFFLLDIKKNYFQYLLYFEDMSRGLNKDYKIIKNWEEQFALKEQSAKKEQYKNCMTCTEGRKVKLQGIKSNVKICNCEEGAKYLFEHKDLP